MDIAEQELQHLGFFAIFKESFKFIFSKKKIFSLITIFFIFPLAVIYIFNFVFSLYLFFHLLYHSGRSPFHPSNISHYYSMQWVTFLLFKVGYLIVCFALSLLSTAAVVYTVACLYTGNDATFKKVMGVVPKVWKRLVITFMWSVGILFLFNLVTFFIFYLLLAFTRNGLSIISFIIGLLVLTSYFIGFVYLSMVCQLANVVSMLEDDCYGKQAMVKAKGLVKGKKTLAGGIFFVLSIVFLGLHVGCEFLLVDITAVSLIIGVLLFFLLVKVILLGLVVQTVLYLVCKSYHGEKIDRSLVSGQLDVIHLGRPAFDAKGDHIELGDHVRV